jgi:hypothetical protein
MITWYVVTNDGSFETITIFPTYISFTYSLN